MDYYNKYKTINIPKDYYLDDGYNETDNYDDCVKIVIRCKDDTKKKEIVQMIKGKIDIHVYASRSHINIIHKSVNKEKALKRLINIEKLDASSLYVIGDNDNDYQLCKAKFRQEGRANMQPQQILKPYI